MAKISVTIGPPHREAMAEWHDLLTRAAPNVFMNPVALCAAAETGFARIHLLQAWEEGEGPRRLVGQWALATRKLTPFGPAVLDALPYDYAFLSTPVIDPRHADDVLPAFFAAIGNDPALPRVVHLDAFDRDTPGFAALGQALARTGGRHWMVAAQGRPCVSREAGVKRSGATRKKLRQDWNRLAACGMVAVSNERSPAAVAQAFEAFLALERRSWKGERGTALLCSARDAAFVRRLIADLCAVGAASVALLLVDGEAIAAQVLMYCGDSAYTWKIAFDSAYARYSPGALLVDKAAEQLLAEPGLKAIDSCSPENGFMGRLWTGRRPLVEALIQVGGGVSPAFPVEAARLKGYRAARRVRDWLRARRGGGPAAAARAPVTSR